MLDGALLLINMLQAKHGLNFSTCSFFQLLSLKQVLVFTYTTIII